MKENNRYFKRLKTFWLWIHSYIGLRSLMITLLLLSGYHFLQPKPPQLGMVNLHEINQSFIYFLAQQKLSDEEKTKWLQHFSNALNDEMERLSKDVVLFPTQQVVTPLPDYTAHIKESISNTLMLTMSKEPDDVL